VAETEEYARRYFAEQRASNREYWRRFGAAPDWVDKRVLEVGCGHGAMSIEIAEAGATVLGVDLDEFRVDFANHNLAQRFSHLVNRVTFQAVDVTSLPPEQLFDVIVSKDTFEHVEGLASLLKGLGQRLIPGGLIYAGFSPLYYSPWGDHGRTGLKVPWAHAILPTPAVCAAAARHNGHPVRSLMDIGLNGNTPDQFRAAFADSGLRLRDIAYNRGDKRLLSVLEKARGRFPRFDRFTTVSIYAVLAA
jgi:cyclopropane fatty-acyl-phospholipid synthase-like methyltransferase